MIKVAGYCRVSTDKEDQANSYVSQQRFFREYIERHPDWELHEIYADEGITGTSTKKRTQFNRMMNDAYNNAFKLIMTKEVSRFSRNILDTITYTRELKALGIGVLFMSDGFSSLDPDAELRLSIMGSIAQEESRRTSARVKWGQTRQMERGVVFGTSMLGYDVAQGKMSVNPQGAEIIKQIFHKYGIEKKGISVIARELREAGHKTYTGNPIWSGSHLLKILKNEKYVGDLVQKKTITPDYLTHEKKYNQGEEELIMIRDHHEAIVSRDLWNLVQEEIRKRHRVSNSSDGRSNRYIFSGKIVCAECGARFVAKQKTRPDGSSYRRWGCYSASRDGIRKIDSHGNTLGCDVGKQIRDDLAEGMLSYVIGKLDVDREQVIADVLRIVLCVIRDGMVTADNQDHLFRQIERITDKKTRAIDCYLAGDITKDEFSQIKASYDSELKILHDRLKRIQTGEAGDGERFAMDLQGKITSVITGKERSETFMKVLLEYMIIHKEGIAEIKLNKLDTIWRFQLYSG